MGYIMNKYITWFWRFVILIAGTMFSLLALFTIKSETLAIIMAFMGAVSTALIIDAISD